MSKFGREKYMSEGMKGVESTPEEQERLAETQTNNNGSLTCKVPPQKRSMFKSTRVFMVVFLTGWIMQGMFFTYFVSVITTMERLFQIESKTSGSLLAATEIGQICTALFLTYFAGRGHRPRWIGCMMLVLALGIIGCMMPHIFYGTRLLDAHKDTYNTTAEPLCLKGASPGPFDDTCRSEVKVKQQSHDSMTAVIIPWLFCCLLLVGIGQTGICTLGIPYIDDNVGSHQSPLYMAITIGIRIIGPALGFLLGAVCTRVYVNPLEDPHFGPDDPQWVSAWWLGMVLVASCIVTLSMLMFCFPRQIRDEPQSAPVIVKSKPKMIEDKPESFITNFYNTIKRQLTNDILMCRTASSVLHLVPMNGLYSFLPKYLETQYRLQPYDANLVSGVGGILVMGLGIITSGIVILKLVPTAKQVAAWTAITAFIYSAGMLTLMFIYCPGDQLASIHHPSSLDLHRSAFLLNSTRFSPVCASECECTGTKHGMVCGQDGLTYYSACHAGCRNSTVSDGRIFYFNCECVNGTEENVPQIRNLNISEMSKNDWGYARLGDCTTTCTNFYVFLAIFAFIMFMHASGEVGSVLLIIRCTDPKDKAMAMGVIQFAIGLFGNVPCPIVFGSVVDAACALRDVVCDALGPCVLYDNAHFRHYFLGLTGSLMFLGFLVDIIVWRKAGRIDISPDRTRDTPLQTLAPTQ